MPCCGLEWRTDLLLLGDVGYDVRVADGCVREPVEAAAWLAQHSTTLRALSDATVSALYGGRRCVWRASLVVFGCLRGGAAAVRGVQAKAIPRLTTRAKGLSH